MGEVMALGQDLGADEDVDLTRMNLVAHTLPCPLPARAVTVNPHQPCLRKPCCKRRLDALSALADR